MRGKEDFRDSPEPESKFLFPSRDSVFGAWTLDWDLDAGLSIVLIVDILFTRA